MNYKPDEATMIAYLYGELSGVEREKVEQYLAQHPDERARLEDWSFTRKVMAGLPEKEVIAPPAFASESRTIPIWRERYFRMTVGIAASFLVLLVAAKLLGLSASYSQGELRLGFGEPRTVAPASLTEQRVQDMIQASLVTNNDQVKKSWDETRESMEATVKKGLGANSAKIDRFMQNASENNQEQVRTFVAKLQKDNLDVMREYMQLSASGQKEYIENLMVDFSKYLQEQRSQDLQLFQVRMNSLEQNTDQLKQETSQLMTSLINNGSTTGNTFRN